MKMKDSKPTIPCAGYCRHTWEEDDWDCAYKYAGEITCDDCIANGADGGDMDPRTGKKFARKNRAALEAKP